MLIVRPIGVGAGRYYERGPDPGRWVGAGAEALGLQGMPSPDELRQVLGGLHPTEPTRLGRAHPHRRAGWDLIFAAPKSVSLVAALAPASDSRTVRVAHRQAVASTVAWFEAEACWARRDRQRVSAAGMVAAVYEHGNSAAGDPHLHTHVLVANVVQGPDGRWSALDSSALWRDQPTIGALYSLALRHQLVTYGLRLPWTIDPKGWADLAGVPRAAIEAASFRRRQVQAEAATAGPLVGQPALRADGSGVGVGAPERDAEPSGPRGRRGRVAAVRTRAVAPARDWRARLAEAGFGPSEVLALLGPGRYPGSAPEQLDEPSAARAQYWLAERGSSWSRSDAVCALAATLQVGGDPARVTRWVDQLGDRSRRIAPDRWTTALADSLDRSVLRAASPRQVPAAVAAGPVVAEALAARRQLSPEARATVRRLATSGAGVEVLAGAPGRHCLVEQAAILDAARSAWSAVGARVALDAEPGHLRRWASLSGLRPEEPGASAAVLVVDRADRRSSRELASLLDRTAAGGVKVVLVIGGTAPARRSPRCAALTALGAPHLSVGPEMLPRPGDDEGETLRAGQVVACGSTDVALESVLRLWEAGRGDDALRQGTPAHERPLLVGLGTAEVGLLNRAARARLQALGLVGEDTAVAGGRPFAVGDRVLARAAGTVPAGTLGIVTAAPGGPAPLSIRWDAQSDEPVPLPAWEAQRLVYGYAATPRVAARLGLPTVVLGNPAEAAALRGLESLGVTVAPSRPGPQMAPDRLAPDPLARVAERRAATLDRTAALGRAGPAVRPAAVPRPAEPARTNRGGPAENRGLDEARLAGAPATGPRPAGPAGVGQSGSEEHPWATATDASLHELGREQERLASRLRSSLPPDVAGEWRRAAEDRAWYRQRGAEVTRAEEEELARRAEHLRRAEDAGRRWEDVHGGDLDRWQQLGRLIEQRADLVAHAAVVDPTHPARQAVGPEPTSRADRELWQRAVEAVALHAERWPEDGPGLPHSLGSAVSVPLLASRQRRDRAVEELRHALERTPGHHRHLDQGLSL